MNDDLKTTEIIDTLETHRQVREAVSPSDSMYILRDSLDMIEYPRDSLAGYDHAAIIMDSLPPEITSADIFGAQSYLYSPNPVIQAADVVRMADSTIYVLCVTILLVVYLFTVFRYPSEVGVVFRGLFIKNYPTYREEHVFASTRFARLTLFAAFMTFGITVMRVLETFTDIIPEIPVAVVAACIPLSALTLLLISLIQHILLKMVGALVLKPDFAEELMITKQFLFSLFGLAAAPLILVTAFADGLWVDVTLWIVVGMINAVILIYLIKSLLFFLSQKVSILFWILYLCAVELMLFSVIIISLARLV